MYATMIAYAFSLMKTPYLWGGNNVLEGFDCSGFVQEVLASVGRDPKGDQTAQTLYNDLAEKSWRSGLGEGSILFFGSSRFEITHTAIAINDRQMIEAGGGNSKTVNIDVAIAQGASVRMRPIRKDLVAAIKPKIEI